MQTTPGTSLTPADNETRPGRRTGALLTVALAVYVVDLVSKIVAVERLADREPVELLDGLLRLRLVRNPGAAFGIAEGMTVLLSLVAVAVAVAVLRAARQLRSLPWAVALGMLLGGSLGNLTDRVFRSPGPFQGHVVDFLELPNWPVFNLADSAILAGSTLMVLLSLRGLHLDGTRAGAGADADT